jgi:hypothetical protein
MDLSLLLVVLILVVLFASISVIGNLRRLRAAAERTVELLEAQRAGQPTSE